MATTVLGLKTFTASDPVDYNEINDNYNKIDNGVKTAFQGRAAHNLLDNSDWRIKDEIVNQRGADAYTKDSGYTIDRWKMHWSGDGNITLQNGYITLYRKTYSMYLFQIPANVESMVGKTYTIAAKVRYNGYIGWIDSTQRTHCDMVHLDNWAIITHTFTVGSSTSDIGSAGVELSTSDDMSFEVQWVALYEGKYNTDTLPEYQTKGYSAELAECRRYLRNNEMLNCVKTNGNYYSISQTIDMYSVPTVEFLAFSPYGKSNITNFDGCSISIAKTSNGIQRIMYADLPTCSEHSAGGLSVNFNSEI